MSTIIAACHRSTWTAAYGAAPLCRTTVPQFAAERKLQVGLAEPESAGYNHASLGLVAQLVEQRIENPCVG
ncbi:hypothetical protein, partial [Massilia sp.]|uniref:hypothetical protein n=1 Tax=Massilia sp. TaxID=1882437 RepID=UPI0028A5C41F